jgi:hypothetical protein
VQIDRWFWCSVFSQRYESGTDTKSVSDVSELYAWIEGGEEPKFVKNFRFDTNELRIVSEQRNAVYRGLISLIVRNGALDFHTFSKITTIDLQKEGIEDHHVFPYQYLTDIKFKGEAAKNSVLNKTLIDASTNSSIGKRPPSSYLKDIRADKLEAILNSHLLIQGSSMPLLQDKFEDFLVQRQNVFAELIAHMTEAIYDPSTKVVSSPTFSAELEELSADEDESSLYQPPGDLSDQLTRSLGEIFSRVGTSNIYRSQTRNVVARRSRRYQNRSHSFWFRLSIGDLESLTSGGITHFAYVCADYGTVLVSKRKMESSIKEDKLSPTVIGGIPHHYHIHFLESQVGLEWLLRHGSRENIQDIFYPMK